MNADERQQRIDDVKVRLRRALDDLDHETRLPNEPPLRIAVAEQARQRLREIDDGMECGITSPEVPGYGYAYCELRPGHDGPHREREDGHVWEAEA